MDDLRTLGDLWNIQIILYRLAKEVLYASGDPRGLGPLLSHLGGPQPQRHSGIGRIVFSTAEEIGQGLALEQVQLHQA